MSTYLTAWSLFALNLVSLNISRELRDVFQVLGIFPSFALYLKAEIYMDYIDCIYVHEKSKVLS